MQLIKYKAKKQNSHSRDRRVEGNWMLYEDDEQRSSTSLMLLCGGEQSRGASRYMKKRRRGGGVLRRRKRREGGVHYDCTERETGKKENATKRV